MKDRRDRRAATINVAKEIITTKTYGDVLSYEYLVQMLEEEVGTIGFAVSMSILKGELIKHGLVLSCLINEGYKILFPNEIAKEVLDKYVMKSVKSLEKGMAIMQYTDISTLTIAEANEFRTVSDMLDVIYKNSTDEVYKTQLLINEAKVKELGE